ncbi:MAG: hypothetical protein ACTHMZ_06880 [Actinomycetes bacterium]
MSTSLVLSLRTRWHRDALDEKLAFGADPTTNPELALRATQLRSRAGRDEIAAGLERVLHEVSDRWPPAVSHIVPLRYEAIHAHARDLYWLARRLRDEDGVDVRGAAMAARLLSDGTGPLYRDGNGDLAYASRAARLALDPTPPASWDVAAAA